MLDNLINCCLSGNYNRVNDNNNYFDALTFCRLLRQITFLFPETILFTVVGCQRVNMASIAGVGGDSADVGEKLLNDNVNSQDKMDTTQVPAMVGATGDEKPKKKTIPLPQTALEQRFFTVIINSEFN